LYLVVTAPNLLYHKEQFFFNLAPQKPSEPQGNTEGNINTEYNFTTDSTDPEGKNLYYWFNWGDGTNSGWDGPHSSGANATVSHAWTERGYFSVKVKAKDEGDVESEWSDEVKISISNDAPKKPSIKGKKFWVIPGKEYEYTFKATDSDNDDVYILVKWAGGSQYDTYGPINSGEDLVLKHTFTRPLTTYIIQAKSVDIFGEESDWESFFVLTPKTAGNYQQILERLLDRFPILRFIVQEIFY